MSPFIFYGESEKSQPWHCHFWIFAFIALPHTVYTPKIDHCVFPKLYIKHNNTPGNTHRTINDNDSALYLFVTQSRDRVNVLLLDHEGCQVGCVGSQEDDSEESPDQDHDLTGGALWILNGDRVVEDDSPQQPHWLPNSESGTAGI